MVREVEVNNYLNLLYYSRGRKIKSVAFGQAAGGGREEKNFSYSIIGVIMSKKKKAYYSGIGGQAVLEGIMMRNKNKYSIVVRKSDGTMETVVKDVTGNPDRVIKKIPFVRGIFAFAESLKLGTEALEYSAEFYGTDTTEPTGFDKFLNKLFGKHTDGIISAITMILSLVVCLGFFIVLPFVASMILEKYIINNSVISIIEGLIRILLFVIYALIMSFVKDTRRTFMYHGAEHKCINCIEHGKKLTLENVRNSSRLHGRCGTNFIFIIAIITIIAFVFFFKIESTPLRLVLRIAVIPVIAGVSYEILWIIGKFNCLFTRILAAPGMALQFITTKEPDDEMIMVAINAVEAVYDWKSFILEKFPEDVIPEELGLEVKEEDKVKISPKKEIKTNGKVKKKKKDIKDVIRPEETVLSDEVDITSILNSEEDSDELYVYENVTYTEDMYESDELYEDIAGSSEVKNEEIYENVEDSSEEVYEEVYEKDADSYVEEEIVDEPEDSYDELNEEVYENDDDSYIEEEIDDSYIEDEIVNESEEAYEDVNDEVYVNEEVYEEEETYEEASLPEWVEDNPDNFLTDEREALRTGKTQPIKLDFTDDYGFDPDDEEVPMDTMSFEPVDESITSEINLGEYGEDYEEYDGPMFSKNIVSIPMPEKINIVEVIPEGGMTSRIYNYDEDDSDTFDDDEEEDFENIFDDRGRLNIKDTEAFSKKIDDEFDALFKSLGLEDYDD